jgi:diguanylate cyclase (GGDEF)-like protein/PAS domain S-box-containing protein
MLGRTQRQLHIAGLIGQLESLAAGEVEQAAAQVTELAAQAIGCERANVWLFDEHETELRCIDAYEATPARHSSGMVLREENFRNEFRALRHARYVDANDALTDPRTIGYVDTYVRPLRITSMLDAVIRVSGRNMGLLCLEHVDRPHQWEQDEIAFACQIADKIGLALLTRTRLQSERRLRESEAALADAQAVAHLGSWECDEVRLSLTWSAETYRIFGVDRHDFTPTLDSVIARIHPDDRDSVAGWRRQSLETAGRYAFDHRIVLDDGTVRHVQEIVQTFTDTGGRIVRSVGTVQDITEQKEAEARLAFAHSLLRIQAEMSPDGILVVDDHGRILSHNERFAEIWRIPRDLLDAGAAAPVLAAVVAGMREPDAFMARVRELYERREEEARDELETADGRWIERHTAALWSPSRQYLGRVWYFRDITERKRTEAEIRYSATHDALTGLANRSVFKAEVERAMIRARRTGRSAAVLCLDLDHFKDINDTLGHPAGDELLRQVAGRLRSACRADDTVARFGGDEFAVVASHLTKPEDASVLATALIGALGRPFVVHDNIVRAAASVGIVTYLDESVEAEALLSRGDVALYRAKSEERGTYRFFTEAMDREVRTRVKLGAQLRDAVDGGQLRLLYQPQVNALTGRLTGVEALVRWDHPDLGLLEPSRFIPVAEHAGLIGPVSFWILREACRQARAWRDAGFALETMAVNLSALQFKTPSDVERGVATVLADTRLPASVLELEITESALLILPREDDELPSRLRAYGIRFAIDDFGIGHSSLDYLRRVPVDRIKIPREFVRAITERSDAAAIVRATIGLARELGIAVIAEGVETEDQVRMLTGFGCEMVQGFFYARPMSADDIAALLRQTHPFAPLSVVSPGV